MSKGKPNGKSYLILYQVLRKVGEVYTEDKIDDSIVVEGFGK